jgi:hypothetical protein
MNANLAVEVPNINDDARAQVEQVYAAAPQLFIECD